jgi:hypothetical protein
VTATIEPPNYNVFPAPERDPEITLGGTGAQLFETDETGEGRLVLKIAVVAPFTSKLFFL